MEVETNIIIIIFQDGDTGIESEFLLSFHVEEGRLLVMLTSIKVQSSIGISLEEHLHFLSLLRAMMNF